MRYAIYSETTGMVDSYYTGSYPEHQCGSLQTYTPSETAMSKNPQYIIDGEVATAEDSPHRLAVFNTTSKLWEVSLEVVQADAIKRIKSLTQSYIFSHYSQPKQANMQAYEAALSRIQSGTYPDGSGGFLAARELTTEEITELTAVSAAWNWIKAARDASNVAELAVIAAETYEDVETLITDYIASLV